MNGHILLVNGHTHVLEAVAIIALGVSAIFLTVNYMIFAAAVAASVLIAMGVPHPSKHAAEAQRVLFTFIGVAIGAVITLLTNLLSKRTTQQPQGRPTAGRSSSPPQWALTGTDGAPGPGSKRFPRSPVVGVGLALSALLAAAISQTIRHRIWAGHNRPHATRPQRAP